jgi:heterodisulfide reductase subunit A-like polyferredoxin
MLKDGELGSPKSIVMIQCVGSREEGRTYCSRICCMNAIKNALIVKEKSSETEVYVLYRDIQAYGKNYEEYYTDARESGVVFILYDKDKKPEVSRSGRRLKVSVFNVFMRQQVALDADLVVLSTPLVQHEEGRNLARVLRVPLGPDGFFMEAHAKLRPIDFATDGIYVCGTAQSPKNIPESIAQAYGAASRAGILMAVGKVTAEAITAMVDEEICRGCGRCEEACEFNAITVEDTGGSKLTAKVREAVCKGCGVCSVTCPTGAITMRHFTNKQINAMLKAALAPGRS